MRKLAVRELSLAGRLRVVAAAILILRAAGANED